MAVNVWQGVQQGQQLVDGLFQQQDQMRAGRALAGGNYAQAMQALGAGGNIQGVRQLQGDQIAMQDRQAAEAKAQQAQQLNTTLQVVRTLKRARSENQDLGALVEQYRPAFAAMGTDPAQFDAIAQQIATNPGLLDEIETVIGEQARNLEVVNFGSGRGAAVVDLDTGNEVRRLNPDQQPITVANNSVLYDPVRGEALVDTRSPEYIQRDPTRELIEVTPRAASTGGGASSTDSIIDGVIRREGGFVARDGRSGAPANFGINQRANPDIDVANLTEPQARAIYQERYVAPIVAAGVSGPALEAVVDFGVNAGVNRSLDFWRRSGGDINEFNKLRLQHYRSLPDYEQNGRSWERRVAETTPGRNAGSGGGARVVSAAQAPQETAAQQAASAARSFTQERQLRTDIGNNPAAKELALVRPHIQTIGRIAGQVRDGRNVSAQDDLALIFAFMKVLDPTSVVREGEFANAQNTGGIAENVVNAYNKALNGERLTDRQRSEFFRTANGMMRDRQANYQEVVNRQRDLASQYGLSPDRVAPAQPAGGQQGPRVRFELSPQQQAWVSQNGRAESGGSARRAGSRENPRLINPASATQSYNNIPSGSYFLTPDGQLRQKR